jgi:hypothetical protein
MPDESPQKFPQLCPGSSFSNPTFDQTLTQISASILQHARRAAGVHDAEHCGRAGADVPRAAGPRKLPGPGHVCGVQLADEGVVIGKEAAEIRGDEPAPGRGVHVWVAECTLGGGMHFWVAECTLGGGMHLGGGMDFGWRNGFWVAECPIFLWMPIHGKNAASRLPAEAKGAMSALGTFHLYDYQRVYF